MELSDVCSSWNLRHEVCDAASISWPAWSQCLMDRSDKLVTMFPKIEDGHSCTDASSEEWRRSKSAQGILIGDAAKRKKVNIFLKVKENSAPVIPKDEQVFENAILWGK